VLLLLLRALGEGESLQAKNKRQAINDPTTTTIEYTVYSHPSMKQSE
jgi:hypothetical protein